MRFDIHHPPVDSVSAEALAARELRLGLVDTSDTAIYDGWLQAVSRGFHGPSHDADGLSTRRGNFADRRISGVWDDGAADAVTPVGTASSWVAELTVPGDRSAAAWAISTVTVAASHRRRGIARNLIEAELRTAATLGIPVAMLTASEATIYERFGFAPAAMIASWTIDTGRARWAGPTAPGRVQLVPLETVRDGDGHEFLERVRLRQPGQIQFDGMLWNRLFGVAGTDEIREIRVVRYDDEDGTPQGFAAFRVARDPHFDAKVEVKYLLTATDDAYAGLWRFLLETDLVTSVSASLRPVDEPLRWQVTDARAVAKTAESDHLWARILDVKAALEARTYSAPGRLVLEVDDAIGFAKGRYLLEITVDGAASVNTTGEDADLALSVADLAAIYLGGTPASTLARAGRITELRAGAAAEADASFRSAVTPWLSIWF